MKTFVRVSIIIWTLAFVGGLITGKSAFGQDCKYRQTIKLDDDGKVLSSKQEYICKESKPIIVLPPNTYTEIKKVRPRVVSYQDYVNGNFYQDSNKGLDFLFKLVYNNN